MRGESERLRQRLAPLARIIEAAALRYEELGAVRGNLRVERLTEAERVALSGLLGEPVRTKPGERLILPLQRLDAVLRERALGESLLEVAAAVTGREISTRAERAGERQARWERLLLSHLPPSDGRAASWRERLLTGESSATALLKREFQQEERAGCHAHTPLAHALRIVTDAVDQLPADRSATLRLPVFASQLTGDPHGFDEERFAGRLLLRALTDLVGKACGVAQPPADAVDRGILLTAAGLLPDGISSTIACFGLVRALRADGSPDPQVEGARADGEVLLASLRQVSRWQSLACGPVLYAVENPPVFEELVDALKGTGRMLPLVCTSGFQSAAAHRVLGLAVAAGATIRYGGDFDGNGLAIAARLAAHHGEQVQFWRMAPADYALAAGHPLAKAIEAAEAERLARIAEPRLQPLAEQVRKSGRVAYQEALLPELKRDLLGAPE